MTLRARLRHVLAPLGRPILQWLREEPASSAIAMTPLALPETVPFGAAPVPATAPAPVDQDALHPPFELMLLSIARSLAATGDHRIRLPTEGSGRARPGRQLRVGFFGNIANNAYNFVKSLRRKGYDVELVVEDAFFDAFLLNRPFWEDVDLTCDSYEEGARLEANWHSPPFVRRVVYDQELGQRFIGRYSAIPEVKSMYKDAFGRTLADDAALALAQLMGHWPYLLAMARYDVVQLSGAPMALEIFCPTPSVVFPTGSDLFISPFEETFLGLLARAGFRRADHVIVCEPNYPEYLDRLRAGQGRTYLPLMVDTEIYCPGSGDVVRERWKKHIGGSIFILAVCRQSWQWKGSDRLLRAFARARQSGATELRLVLLGWGPDVVRSRKLIEELGLETVVAWEPLCSKSALRKRQRAADVVADQFVMAGYGTSVLESMAAGKPVIKAHRADELNGCIPGEVPFLAASSVDEITSVLMGLDSVTVADCGAASLQWLRAHHGFESLAERYMDVYRSVAG